MDDKPISKWRTRVRRVLAGLLLIVGIAAVAGLLILLRTGPEHKGIPVRLWVEQATSELYTPKANAAIQEVHKIGAPAVPYLVTKLQATDRWKDKWNLWRKRLPTNWQARFPEKKSAAIYHNGAAQTLVGLGPLGQPAVPDLIRLLPEIPQQAVMTLGAIGPGAKEALPALQGMLTNKDTVMRVHIARALWQIGRDTDRALDVCTNVPIGVGYNAANATALLISMGTNAIPATPFVLRFLQDTNAQGRGNAAIFLAMARVDTPEIRKALREGKNRRGGLSPQDRSLPCDCALALWGMDPQYASEAMRLTMEEFVVINNTAGGGMYLPSWLETRRIDLKSSIAPLKELIESGPEELRKEAAVQLANVEARIKELEGGAGQKKSN